MNAPSTDRLERWLGRILTAGALGSTTLLSAGLLLELLGLAPGVAAALTHVGLIVLMATPVARVVASVIEVRARTRLGLHGTDRDSVDDLAGQPNRGNARVAGKKGSILRSCDLRCGDLAIWRSGDLAIWRSGDLAIWRSGDRAIGRSGDRAIGRSGELV